MGILLVFEARGRKQGETGDGEGRIIDGRSARATERTNESASEREGGLYGKRGELQGGCFKSG